MSERNKDYFVASSGEGSLAMRPYCGECGVQLNEDYYCEDCNRQCRCMHIRCEDEESYSLAYALLRNNEKFKNFTIEKLHKPSQNESP